MTITSIAGRCSHQYAHERFSPEEQRNAERAANLFRSTLELPTEDRHFWDPGYSRGHLDESTLWQLAAGVHKPRCFMQPETIRLPSVYLGLLVDCSGSMSGGYISRARTLALAFAKALDGHPKCKVSVAGHTERRGKVLLYMIKRSDQELNPEAFGSLTAQSGNLDAYALQAYARTIAKDMQDFDSGLIGLICDGEPCHSKQAMQDAIVQVRKDHRLHTVGIGIGGDMNDKICTQLYGAGNYIIAGNPMDCLPNLATKLNRFIAQVAPV